MTGRSCRWRKLAVSSHANHTQRRGGRQVVDLASEVAKLTWVRFPSPAPIPRQAETASANTSRSFSREPRLDRAGVPGLDVVPRWLLPSGAGSGFTRGRWLQLSHCDRISMFEADVRDRVLSDKYGLSKELGQIALGARIGVGPIATRQWISHATWNAEVRPRVAHLVSHSELPGRLHRGHVYEK